MSTSNLLRRTILSAAVATLLLSTQHLNAASKAEKQQAAEELVKEALNREVYGLDKERDELLKRAAEQVPGFAPAMWHQGFVRHKNEWIPANELPQRLATDPRMMQYEQVRADHPDTIQGHLAIAQWCHKRGLEGQERAHLTEVLQHNPNHLEARHRLGFQFIDGNWMHVDEIAESVEQMKRDREAMLVWGPKVENIRKNLLNRSQLKRNNAKAQLAEITDEAAIPALESILAFDSEESAQLVIETIGNISSHEAAISLAGLSIHSPWPAARQSAAAQLKTRPEETYVPSLLATLYSPVQMKMEVTRGRSGRLLYRHAFYREGQKENQLLVLDTEYRRIQREGGSRRDSLERALNNLNQRMQTRAMSISQENRRTQELNERIMGALALATGQQIPAKPESWWEWWNQHNEVFLQGAKQLRAVNQVEQVAVVDRNLDPSGGGQRSGNGAQQATMDCLAAGTNVMTATGQVAIEKIQVGDLVLSQDTDSGELAYKPVLRTTVRPASALVQIKAGGHEICTSGGHPFWISGEGWVKARDLEPGMELHGIGSTVQVQSVTRIHAEQTYNLIVADFNNYFAGECKVLSHDNSVRELTDAIVPGLAD